MSAMLKITLPDGSVREVAPGTTGDITNSGTITLTEDYTAKDDDDDRDR